MPFNPIINYNFYKLRYFFTDISSSYITFHILKNYFIPFSFGSKISLNPSPKKIIPKTEIDRIRPGKKHIQGAPRKNNLPSLRIFPQLGTPGGIPNPKKLRCYTIR